MSNPGQNLTQQQQTAAPAPSGGQEHLWNKLVDGVAYCAKVAFLGGITAESVKKKADILENAVEKERADKTDLFRRMAELDTKYDNLALTLRQCLMSLESCQQRLVDVEKALQIPVKPAPIAKPPKRKT